MLEGVLGSGPERVDVFLHSRKVYGYHFLTILALHFGSTTQIFGSTVITFRTPSNIVQVAHSVHHQNIHICDRGFRDRGLEREQPSLTGGQQEHVLDEGREHVEGFKVEERAAEVQSVGGNQRNGNVSEGFIVPDQSGKDVFV